MHASEPRDPRRSRGSVAPGPRRWWAAAGLTVAAAVVAAALLRVLTGPVYLIPSGSMEPTLLPGDRVHVDTSAAGGAGLARGDVVVVDGSGSLAPYRPRSELTAALEDVAASWGLGGREDVFVKRVLALPGDTLACCADDGRLLLDGRPLDEPWLGRAVTAAAPASAGRWEFAVPEGRMVLLGDNRAASRDSRDLLGAPGGGLVPVDSVLGSVDAVVWPLDRRGPVPAGAADTAGEAHAGR
ncbi:signal peptidase I [Micrococcus sp.]|uniref:signal peptidase I n=1 Tax=Micrococcus sp. TaxID=1271 RepID=UPI002A914203|nr:signal peptidase I [Micrococcus sp.]MDY6054301.1 signal peptidase I [Micrococcus sp.]